MRLNAAVLGLAAWAAVSAASAQTPGELRQAIAVEQYRALPPAQRQIYVAGVLDADRIFFQQTKPMFAACLNGVTLAQATAIADSGLTTLPPAERQAVPLVVHNALVADCARRGYTVP